MLTKSPKPAYKRYITWGIKGALLIEGIGLAASYGLWYKLNTDRDFRLYMFKNHNWVLEGYYGIGEAIADQKIRDLDQAIWSNEGKI
ncbi:protein CEBPZOS isoform X2 [Helicoverpa armigera]|uniref:protein CEBPZOS isoform X2 n=1 Tax=Helicoverpa armigera TaxID=29058 RepID=UPI000DAB1574|nr:hypothetical protein B5X24_HaOG213722 [Helicoverpa armigera]